MPKIIKPDEKVVQLEKENKTLKQENYNLRADLEFIAMMTDVEIDDQEEE